MPVMRRLLASLVLVLLLGAGTSCSTDPIVRRTGTTGLDELFQRLRTTQNAEEAQMIEVAIRHVWASSGRPVVDSLMAHAVEAMHRGDHDQALDALDKAIGLAPDFAEGWNLRATIHYLRDEYPEAVADIERTLMLEPRHFGALTGLGHIMLEFEDKRWALWAFERALAINPHLGDVRSEVSHLRDQMAGLPI